MAEVTIETIKNGPYIVNGEVELMDSDGNKFPVEKRMALCRCGASTEKPFCGGTHSKIGFQAAGKAVPESKEYKRSHEDARLCCLFADFHAGKLDGFNPSSVWSRRDRW